MMKKYFNSLRLIWRMRWITVIPALFLFIVTMTAYVKDVADDYQKDVLLQSQSIALGLSSVVEISLKTNDELRLIELITPIVEREEVLFINVLNSQKEIIASHGENTNDSIIMKRVELLAPEIENPFGEEGSGLDQNTDSNTVNLGYIEVAMKNKGFFEQRKKGMFFVGISLFSVLVIALFLADKFTKKITRSITEIIATSEANYGEERFSIPYVSEEKNEIGELIRSKEKERKIIKSMLDQETSLRQKADAANIAKTYLLKLISHEMNQPLASAYGLTQVLLKKATDDNDIFYLDIIKQNIELNNRFLDDLLQLADIDSNRLQVINEPMDIVKVFKSVCEPNKLEAKAKNLKLTYLSSNESTLINSDKHRLEQIISNLLSNAIKYTNQGKIDARLSTFIKGNKVFIEITIEDTGIGIKQEDQAKVFEMFERVDVSDTRNTQGKGLGLYVVMKTVKALGGYIELHSDGSTGSRFTVKMEAPKEESLKVIDKPAERLQVENLLVMVVDDYSDTNIAFQAMLELIGAKVILCSEGEEAIKVNSEKKPDVIILDCQLPGMSGPDIARAIRKQETENNLKASIIIGCSGAGGNMKDRCLDAGMDGFMKKPPTIQEMVSTINKAKGAKWFNSSKERFNSDI